MSIYEHQSTFAGLPVVNFDLKDPNALLKGAIRLSTDEDNYDAMTNQAPILLDALASSPNKNEVSAIVIGPYGACYEVDTQAIVQWFVDNPTIS